MLKTYTSATGRQFVFNPDRLRNGEFFYSPDGHAYYHLYGFGCAIGENLRNTVCYQNVCHGLSGRFFFGGATLTVEHEDEQFTLDPDAVFEAGSVQACPVSRIAWRVLTHPDGSLLYVSYAQNGFYETRHRIFVARNGITTPGHEAARNIVLDEGTRFEAGEHVLTWGIDWSTNLYRYTWNGVIVTEAPIGDYRILETLDSKVTITKK